MSKGVKYLNGLAIVSIVFILLSGIPLGILTGIAVSTGGSYSSQDTTVDAGSNQTMMLDAYGYNRIFLVYWISGDTSDFRVYVMTDDDYLIWQNTNDSIPTGIEISSTSEDMYRLLPRSGDHYVYIINDGTSALYYTSHFASAPIGLIIAGSILAVIFAFFMVILVLNTVGYFIKYLIIWPITGAGKYYSNGSSSKKRDSYESKKDRYDYQYVTAVQPTSSIAKTTSRATPAAVAKSATPTPRTAPRAKIPAEHAIGNYIVAGQTKRYDNKSDILNKINRFWDYTSIPERVLGLIAIFFFVLGIVTTSWFLIVVMPVTLLGIASIVFFANKNTTEKLIRTVESYQAIYLRDAARILNTSSDLLRMNTWKIIRLGLAPIGFDTENGIVFDVTKVDPSKKEKLSPAAETIHQQLVAEVDKKEEKKEDIVVSSKEIKCPFCDADNPPDSLFCIKCGASLKPAK
jgi:hypothetical protein